MSRKEFSKVWSESDEEPPWKKELMMKKTAVGRAFQKGTGVCHQTDIKEIEPNLPVVKNEASMKKPHLRSVNKNQPLNRKKMPGAGTEAVIRHANLTDVNHTNSDSTYSDCGRSPTFSSQSDAFSFESDLSNHSNGELEYGPGIVNRLKSRFIHLTLKESERANNMVPMATNGNKMRRYASLEGLVDKALLKPAVNGHAPENHSVNRSHFYQNYNLRRSNMKKARSMDNLGIANMDRSVYSTIPKSNTYDCDLGKGTLNPILINENVVIIESLANGKRLQVDETDYKIITKNKIVTDTSRCTGIEDNEMPKPDTVKTFKQMFEAKKPPDSKAVKPAFKQNVAKQKIQKSNKSETVNGESCDTVLKNNEANLAKQVNNGVHHIENAEATKSPDSEIKLLNDYNHSKQADATVDNVEHTDKIDSDPISVKTVDDEHQDLKSPVSEVKPVNTIFGDNNKPLSNSAPKVVSVHTKNEDKPIANIKPIVNAKQNESQLKKKQEELNNKNSTTEEKLASALSSLPKPRAWHKTPEAETSIVFDFRDRKDIKPHISNKVAPFGCRPSRPQEINIDGIDGDESCDYDGDDSDNYCGDLISAIEPCEIQFEGAQIVIGKSAILTNRNKKLKIQFDDQATSTFEYPSEACMENEDSCSPSTPIEEVIPYADDESEDSVDCNEQNSDASNGSTLKSNTALAASGALSNYTPSSLSKQGESYQLGISRHIQETAITKPQSADNEEPVDEYLKPAEEDQTSSWSSAASSDLLF